METRSSRLPASVVASGVCITLVVGFVAVWQIAGIALIHAPAVAVGGAFFSIALVTTIVYQSLVLHERAFYLAQGMAKGFLAYSHELFSELYDRSPVPYLLIDEKGIIESTNTATVRFFGVTLEGLNGKNVFDFIEEQDEHGMGLIPQYFTQGRSVNDTDVVIRVIDGTEKWATLSLFPFNDPKGAKKGLLTLIDVTKQKMVDRAKTEFVSLASHQLRTPVSAMRWNLELLETAGGETLTPAQRAYVEKISHGLERMDALVNDFLNVSKLELGTLVPQLAPVNLTEFFTSVYDEYHVYAEKRGVRVETNWNEPFGEFTTDAHLLNMAVSNILGNAIKYTPKGGAVRAQATFDGTTLTITIADTGIGIPEEERDQIFSKLFRASNAQTQETDGTGLGLYIVREVIHILGGTIEFESVTGSGTTFTVVLPK